MILHFIFLLTSSLNVFAAIDATELDTLLTKYHETKSFHGSVIILEKDKEVYEFTIGLANKEFEVEHTRDSKFMIASLSKQFTAAVILKLQEEGKLNINDKVSQYIDLPFDHELDEETLDHWNSVTIEQLLTHTSGLKRDVNSGDGFSAEAFNILPVIVDSQLRKSRLLVYKLFKSVPGERFYYSNFGYLLLANIINNSGAIYERHLNNNIFYPLRMMNSGEFHRRKVIKKISSGYFVNDDDRLAKRCCRDASTFAGSHSLYSTIGDLKLWVQELFYSNNVVSKSIVDEMTKGQLEELVLDTVAGLQYGYGFNIDIFRGVKRVWHDGHEMGYVSLISHLPEFDKTIILLSNHHGHVYDELFHTKLHDEIINVIK